MHIQPVQRTRAIAPAATVILSGAAAVFGIMAVKAPLVGYVASACALGATIAAAVELRSRGPRRLGKTAQRRVVEALSELCLPEVSVTSGSGLSEPVVLRNQLVDLLRRAGCKVTAGSSVLATTHEGVAIFYRPALRDTVINLARVLAEANVRVARLQMMSDQIGEPYCFGQEHTLYVSVGTAPSA